MRRHLKARYLGPALLALVMVIYGAVVSISSTRTNLEDFAEVAHSRTVLVQLGDVLSTMQELETGQRGFIISGDRAFLEPYDKGLERINRLLEDLVDGTRSDPKQVERAASAREAARGKLGEMARVIQLRREQGLESSAEVVSAGEGKGFMDRFRSILAEMRHEEENKLVARQRKLIASFKATNRAVVVSAAVAIGAALTGMVLLALFLISRGREERMKFEKEKAQQADKAKTDFLAMMSHEIRTPMNAILGFGELLHDVVDKPQEKHFAKAIVTSGNSLLSLINDILDLSKIEAAKLELHPETVEMSRFIENLETLFSFRTQEKGLNYSITPDASLPRYLSFDALRLRQVLINLIGNAVKFTREGHVLVRVSAKPGEGEITILEFQVEDTGIGIPETLREEIFRPFYQVESEHGRHFQGTGLGLSISERLVAVMGGKIRVESVLGKGSTFHLSLPVQKKEALNPEAEPPAMGRVGKGAEFNRLMPAQILVADDVALNRELIRGYLAGSHHQVLEAENGEQAVMLCRKHLPAVVLMDIRMPVVDGRAAHAMLKADEATRHIPLVAVTASSQPDSQPELKRVFDGFASKPISRERLYMELAKFLPVHSAQPYPRPEPEPALLPDFLFDRTWPELVKLLVPLRDSVWPRLVELVPAQATLQFGENLAALAVKHECQPLAEYSQRLVDAAGTMSFPEAGRLLNGFPDLIERLCHANV